MCECDVMCGAKKYKYHVTMMMMTTTTMRQHLYNKQQIGMKMSTHSLLVAFWKMIEGEVAHVSCT